jgi:hypothetical protein
VVCQNVACQKGFPIVDGIPVLIDEATSVFTIDDFKSRRETTLDLARGKGLIKRWVKRAIPRLGMNVTGRRNYQHLARLLLTTSSSPRVLILGGGILGDGLEALADDPR